MSTPLKPWENGAARKHMLNSFAPMSVSIPANMHGARVTYAPTVPPRPRKSSRHNLSSPGSALYGRQMGYNSYSPYSNFPTNFGGIGNGYGGYGGIGMSPYGGSFGNGMFGNSGVGFGMGPESRFIQLAEESTRPAFQGIESLVHAFSSISMMLDSTYFAVTNSFRAVLGVADNFGRIRTMFGQIWNSFALIRALNWLYKKVLSLLGFKVPSDLGSDAWNQAVNESSGEVTQNVSSWPIFMFLGMIVSAPYFISKLLPEVIDKRDPKNWPNNEGLVSVLFDFVASSPEELTLRPGDKIRLAPKAIQDEMQLAQTGWFYAASNRGAGIVPVTHLQLSNKKSAPVRLVPTSHGQPVTYATNQTPVANPTQYVNQAPYTDQMPVVNQAPVTNQMSIVNNQVPLANQVPYVNQAPNTNQMTFVNEVPFVNQVPLGNPVIIGNQIPVANPAKEGPSTDSFDNEDSDVESSDPSGTSDI